MALRRSGQHRRIPQDDVELDSYPASRTSATDARPDEFELQPVADLHSDDENERLLDPNLPDSDHASDIEDADDGTKPPAAEDSPYPEVRAAVHNYDEDLPCNTVRVWVIGMSLVVVGASTNTLFSLRQPSISIGPLLAQIISWPLGRGWARLVPDRSVRLGRHEVRLNPGPFNVKEHTVIVVMASVAFSVAYATDIILAQLVFYKQDFGLVFQMLLTISTQSLGYGIAGMMRKFLGTHDSSLALSMPSLSMAVCVCVMNVG